MRGMRFVLGRMGADLPPGRDLKGDVTRSVFGVLCHYRGVSLVMGVSGAGYRMSLGDRCGAFQWNRHDYP